MKASFLFLCAFCAALLLLSSLPLFGQGKQHQLKDRSTNLNKRCQKPQAYLKKMPPEARFTTYIQGREIFIYFPNPEVYQKLISQASSGFAIDLMYRNQYACASAPISEKSIIRGELQKPIYRKELNKRIRQDALPGLTIHAGKLPEHASEEQVEANLIYIYKRYPCHYLSIYDIDLSDWELLETGLFQDGLPAPSPMLEDSSAFTKSMRFTIPFEKNRYDYQPHDIGILYDSLRLTDYTITGIRILALTSVEGSEQHNQRLQQERANSLVKALEAYQGSKVNAQISSSENWKDFFQDIAGTPYHYLSRLSKPAVKEQLAKPEIAAALEPVLRRHRKGLVDLQLRKTIHFLQESPEEITRFYHQYVKEEDVAQALLLQEILFERIKNESLPADFLQRLEVPQQSLFGPLLLRRISFHYQHVHQDEGIALQAFEQLLHLLPDNAELGYNIASLRLKQWLHHPESIDSKELYSFITGLRKKGLEQALANRLLLNYYIIQVQQQLYSHNYPQKDRYLQLIQSAYASAQLTDADALRLARFFAFYSRFDWARSLLEQRVSEQDASEDIVFYYINLSLTEKRITQRKSWKLIQEKAFSINPARYCKMFDTRGYGGVSFQLLDDPSLKDVYCRQCEGLR
jgi:outer membrane protein OmpA-like peptidoglycan-associated protein